METKHKYFVLINGTKVEIDANLYMRLKNWAWETKKDFLVHRIASFEKESYSEETMNSNGGYEKETTVQNTLEFNEPFIEALLQSMTFFNWEK